jgi:hypothetical protein
MRGETPTTLTKLPPMAVSTKFFQKAAMHSPGFYPERFFSDPDQTFHMASDLDLNPT